MPEDLTAVPYDELQQRLDAAYEAWKQERDAAEEAWRQRRPEIKARILEEEPIDPVINDDLTRFRRLVEEKTVARKVEVKALERERDAVIARARAEFEKKRHAIESDLKRHKDVLKSLGEQLRVAESEQVAKLRRAYAAERAVVFAEERRLWEERQPLWEEECRRHREKQGRTA